MNARLATASVVTLASFALAACSGDETAREDGSAGTNGSPSEYSASVTPRNESGMQGHVMVTAGPDSLTIKLEVLGLETGTEYPAHLHAGDCEQGGEVVADLDSPTVASVGLGSSLTALSPEVMEDDRAYFVQVHLPDGTAAACAAVEHPAGA